MTLQQLKYMITVAEKGSITEVAKTLYISQPSLSEAIKEVEKEAGITIIYPQTFRSCADKGRNGVFGLCTTGA